MWWICDVRWLWEKNSSISTDKTEKSPQEVQQTLRCPSQTGCRQLPALSPPPAPLWAPAIWTQGGVKEWSLLESGANSRVESGRSESSCSPGGTFCRKWSWFRQVWWRRVSPRGSDCSSPAAETSLWGAGPAWGWDSSCSAACLWTSCVKMRFKLFLGTDVVLL